MATYQSEFGKTRVFEDFLGIDPDVTWAVGGFDVGGVSVTSVNEGSVESTVDEPGGIVAFTVDTGDNDNVALYAGVFQPSLGRMVMEARLKGDNLSDLAFFVGFTETLAKDTPVMPAEHATATMTYNGTGGMVGLQYDADSTTKDWRACAGDGGVATGGAGNGTLAGPLVGGGYAITADRWDVVRVEVDEYGIGTVFLNGALIDTFGTVASPAVTPTDKFHAVVMCENRAASAAVMEVDYFYASGGRDWAND